MRNAKADPFMTDVTLAAADTQTFSNVDLGDGGRAVARPVQLMDIVPDVRQPRRAMPSVVRYQWDGKPSSIPAMLIMWKRAVEEVLDVEIDLHGMMYKKHGAPVKDGQVVPEIAQSFLDLVGLATSIYHDGLDNPIKVVERGGIFLKVIEKGERRYLAHHLLAMESLDFPQTIPAFVKRGRDVDVWGQAAENGARKPLNAIDMARQLALLIMDMYRGDKDIEFDEFDALVLPGGCDRRFYAQVANGNVFRIKDGYSQRILDVTGLKSKAQISQYRRLLEIPDELWNKAGDQNWTEKEIRTYFTASTPPEDAERLTRVNLTDENSGYDGSEDVNGDDPAIVPEVTKPVEPARKMVSNDPDDDYEAAELSGSTSRGAGSKLFKPVEDESFDYEDVEEAEPAAPTASMQPVKVYDTAPIIHEAGWTDANDLFLYLKKVAARTKTNPQLLSKMMDLLTYSDAELHRPGMSPELMESVAKVAYDLIDKELRRVRDEGVRFMKVLIERSKTEAE